MDFQRHSRAAFSTPGHSSRSVDLRSPGVAFHQRDPDLASLDLEIDYSETENQAGDIDKGISFVPSHIS